MWRIVQRVSDTSKGVAVRVGKVEPVAFEDNEKTFPELQERIAKTIKFLQGVNVSLPFLLFFCLVEEGKTGGSRDVEGGKSESDDED
jgi:hypothetical protein